MNRAIVILFLAVITLPLGANLAGVDGADPAAENREMAAWPRLNASWPSVLAFPAALDGWFDDHFGFRARLVRWDGEARLFALGVSPSTDVISGRDGWLYYAEDGGMADYANETPLTPEEVSNWREAIVRARDWLRARGIAYLFVIAPDKHVIYPEYVPRTIRKVGHVSRTDQVYEALEGTGVDAVDVRPALFEAKEHEQLYFLTDTHWNDRGALVAYQQIVQAARRALPAIEPPRTLGDFEPIARQIEGQDLARMMGLKRAMSETNVTLVPRARPRATVVDPIGASASGELGRVVTEIEGSPLPRVVVFRDSFGSRLAPFLSEHFSRAVYLWQNDFDASVVEQERPQIVIQEIVGRHLYNFIPTPDLVPR